MWRRGPRGIEVGRRDEKKGQGSNASHSSWFFSFAFPTRSVSFWILPFHKTLTPKSCFCCEQVHWKKNSTFVSKSPKHTSRMKAGETGRDICLATTLRPLWVSLPVSDRDTGLIWTDAKDLKVSLRISHYIWAERPRGSVGGRRGQSPEVEQEVGFGTGRDVSIVQLLRRQRAGRP